MLTEKELGERLKNVREVRRISQFRLGEMVECGQGHAELTRSVIENKQLWCERVNLKNRAAVECERANYAESHPWRNLWAWFKRKVARHE